MYTFKISFNVRVNTYCNGQHRDFDNLNEAKRYADRLRFYGFWGNIQVENSHSMGGWPYHNKSITSYSVWSFNPIYGLYRSHTHTLVWHGGKVYSLVFRSV